MRRATWLADAPSHAWPTASSNRLLNGALLGSGGKGRREQSYCVLLGPDRFAGAPEAEEKRPRPAMEQRQPLQQTAAEGDPVTREHSHNGVHLLRFITHPQHEVLAAINGREQIRYAAH